MPESLFARSGLSLERLETFSKIAAAAGISAAAPGDPTRQSQFSRQLKELEEFFGCELISRGRGRFALTSQGRDLFRIIQTNFNALSELAQRCGSANVQVSIGAGEGILQWLVTPNLRSFRAAQPETTLVLINLRTEEIITRLTDGRLDIGIVRQDAVRPPLKATKLGSIHHRLIVPKAAAASVAKSVWDILKKLPVAVMHGSAITAALEAECERRGIALDVCFRASSYLQLTEAIDQISCAAVLPTFAARKLIATGARAVDIKELKSLTRGLAFAVDPRVSQLRPTVLASAKLLTKLISESFAERGDT